MSEEEDHIAPEDEQKLVAAEYVLGVLDRTDRRIAARQIERMPALARDVEDWEQRLGSFADGIAPEDPPAQTWDRIEAAIGGPRTKSAPVADPGLWQSLLFWRTFAIGSAALAAASVAGTDQRTAGFCRRRRKRWQNSHHRPSRTVDGRSTLHATMADPRGRSSAFARPHRAWPAGTADRAGRPRRASDKRRDAGGLA